MFRRPLFDIGGLLASTVFVAHFFFLHNLFISRHFIYHLPRSLPAQKNSPPVTKDIPKVILTYNYSSQSISGRKHRFLLANKKSPLYSLERRAFYCLNMGLYGPVFLCEIKNVNNSLMRCGTGIYCEIDVLSTVSLKCSKTMVGKRWLYDRFTTVLCVSDLVTAGHKVERHKRNRSLFTP